MKRTRLMSRGAESSAERRESSMDKKLAQTSGAPTKVKLLGNGITKMKLKKDKPESSDTPTILKPSASNSGLSSA